MQNKNLKILIIVLMVLVGFLGLKTYLPSKTIETSPYLDKIKMVDKSSAQSILIKNTSGSIDLKKENNLWKIQGKKADSAKVENLINQLLVTTPPELIAQTDKRHQEFELTTDKATKVTIDNKLTLLLGKGSGSAVYTRFDGDNSVYLLKDVSLTALSSASDWYDKTILTFDQAKATKITLREGNIITILTKQGDKWMSGDKEAKKDRVDAALSQASGLTAQSLFDATKATTYPKVASLVLTIEYDGKSETLEFYKGSSDYLIKRSSDSEQFVVSEYSISSLISAPKEVL